MNIGEEMEYNTFTLEGDDGEEHEFAVLDRFEFEDNDYISAAEVHGDLIDEEFFLFKLHLWYKEYIVVNIEDDEEFKRVAEFYRNME